MNCELQPLYGNTMNNNATIGEEQLEYARDLVKQLEDGNRENADKMLGKLVRLREFTMFHEMGKLTRELHNTLNGFMTDSRVAGLAEHDLPDAKDRLNYVIHLTEQAANKTLMAVEDAIPICEELEKKAQGINDEWKHFMSKDFSDQEFRVLTQETGSYLDNVAGESSKIKAKLNNVLIAQDFQDLSGQCVHRVISLVQEIEQVLINFIRITDHKGGPTASASRHDASRSEGPQIPGKENTDVMSCQDDVDDLLSSLGF